jgi:selenocysteine lyase/cysteine desulfurase
MAGVPLFVDACQALGQMQIDVTELGCHVLTATGRKFLRAPRGTGMLWVDAGLVERFQPPGLDGTSTKWSALDGLETCGGIARFEEYEVSYAAMVGLASAAAQARVVGIAAIEDRVQSLADHLRCGLDDVPGVTVKDTAERRSAIVTFTVESVSAPAVVDAATRNGISVNASTALWAALDMDAKGLMEVVRASPHYFNTSDELDRLIATVRNLR